MQPILMLAIVGVAAIALGTGFLNNNIELWIQQFGVGSGDITSPIDHITVDFRIVQQAHPTVVDTFENVIDACLLTLETAVGDPAIQDKDSELICKLTGHDELWQSNGEIITEGKLCANSFPAGTYTVLMGQSGGCAPGNQVVVGTPTSVDVRAVGDVIVVAHADTYSGGDHNPGTTPDCPILTTLDPLTNICVPDPIIVIP